jgi:nucleoside-diphosphate-sugar epimerase
VPPWPPPAERLNSGVPSRVCFGPVEDQARRAVVTGGAGFIGSHLCEALLRLSYRVVCVDNFVTGDRLNIAHLVDDAAFELLVSDISEGLDVEGPVDAVLNFASPASPVDYAILPVETLLVGSYGTRNALELATAKGARFIQASTSEVYGDPLVHPQTESYWGNVNPIGPRSVYDEAKRFSESLAMAYHRSRGTDIGIVRIFNTYGPRMRPSDGRVVSNFIVQALAGEPLTVYGDGGQTRSFCFVDDEVAGILKLLQSDLTGPVNIGNPDEFTIAELARLVLEITGSSSPVEHRGLPVDDPAQRRPDINLARSALGWEPAVRLREGLAATVPYFSQARRRAK